MTTRLTPRPTEAAGARLAGLAPAEATLEITVAAPRTTLGHQYLFFVIPFGNIEAPLVTSSLWTSFSEALALRGVRAFPAADRNRHKVRIVLTSLHLTAYDFFFFRRVVCTLRVDATRSSPQGAPQRQWSSSIRTVDFLRFAFQTDLEQILEETIDEASAETVNELFRVNP